MSTTSGTIPYKKIHGDLSYKVDWELVSTNLNTGKVSIKYTFTEANQTSKNITTSDSYKVYVVFGDQSLFVYGASGTGNFPVGYTHVQPCGTREFDLPGDGDLSKIPIGIRIESDQYGTKSSTVTVPDIPSASNGHIKVNGSWKKAFAWIKLPGGWKRCIIWKKINGVWKRGV